MDIKQKKKKKISKLLQEVTINRHLPFGHSLLILLHFIGYEENLRFLPTSSIIFYILRQACFIFECLILLSISTCQTPYIYSNKYRLPHLVLYRLKYFFL